MFGTVFAERKCRKQQKKEVFMIKTLLAIDGGGLFGAGVANWIPKLGDYQFDYYAGTSVGSILASCFAIGLKASEVRDMFNGEMPRKIFTTPGFPKNLNPLRAATYDNVEAKKVLREVFGDIQVGQTKHPLIIVAWNYERKREKVFTHKYNSHYLLRDAVLASISAPTYFPPVKLKNERGNFQMLGDGGVCGNDPSLAGISSMRDDNIQTRHIKCLSIGTTGKPVKSPLNVGTKLAWLPVIIGVITKGNVGYTSYGVKRILQERYMRISPDSLPNGDMDDFKLIPKIKNVWENYEHLSAVEFLKNNIKE